MNEPVDNPVASIYKNIQGQQNKAPAQIGRPVFEKDFEAVKVLGVKSMADIFGHKDDMIDKTNCRSINFGSKKDTCMLPDETRLRLFELKKSIADVHVQASVLFRTANPTADQIMATPLYKNYLGAQLKAFNVTDFAAWIPTVNARFYFDEFEIPYILANEFDQQPMDSATVTIDGALGLLEGKEEGDTNTFDTQANTPSSFTVYARNNVVSTLITEDLLSDSAPAIINKVRKEVMTGNVRAFERALVNGDTSMSSGTRGDNHMDSDIRAVSKHFSKAFNGFRKIAFDNSANGSAIDNAGDSLSKATFTKTLLAMGKYAAEKDDLVWVMGSTNALALITGIIPELSTNFAFGGLASTRTGLLPPVFGVKCVESAYMREDLNASGVYAASSSTTSLLLVKRSRFNQFLRAAAKTWAQPAVNSDQMYMMSKIRHTFGGNPQSATEKSVIMTYNIKNS